MSIIPDKISHYELQKIDCNCNNCGFFQRDVKKTELHNNNDKIVAYKTHYGFCTSLNKDVAEIANICLLHTQKCFKHRLDFLDENERNKKLNII
jgi:hypothetical protein